MPLMKNIYKSIEKTMMEYTKAIAEKHNLDQDELVEMWGEISKMKMKNAKKKMSPWLQFCKEERIRLKVEFPDMKFGEISKAIGDKWTSMSEEEKTLYKEKCRMEQPVQEPKPKKTKKTKKNEVVVPSNDDAVAGGMTRVEGEEMMEGEGSRDDDVVVPKWTRDNLKKMKIADLRKLCEDVKLSRTGKKDEIIDRLLNSVRYEDGNWTVDDNASVSSVVTTSMSDDDEDEQ